MPGPHEQPTYRPAFEARRIAGGPETTSQARPVVTVRGPGLRSPWRDPSPAGFGLYSAFGLGVVLLSLAGLILLHLLPWIQPAGEDSLSRSDIREDGMGAAGVVWDATLAYTRGLTGTPISATILFGICGFLLIATDAVPTNRLGRHGLRVLLTGALTFFSLRLSLTAVQWWGLYVGTLMDLGDARFHLHAGLYALLLMALVGLAGSAWLLRHAVSKFVVDGGPAKYPGALRLSSLTLTVAAAALVSAPLLPIASDSLEDQHLTEVELMQFGGRVGRLEGGGLHASAQDLAAARLMLWLVLAASAVTLGAALFERTNLLPLLGGMLLQAYALNGILVVVGFVYTGLLYFKHLGEIDLILRGSQFRPVWNWFLPAGFAALSYLVVRYAFSVVLPFVRQAMSSRARAAA